MRSQDLISIFEKYYLKIQQGHSGIEIEKQLEEGDHILWNKYTDIVRVCPQILGSPVHIAVNKYNLDSSYTCWTDHGVHHSFSIIYIINDINRILSSNLRLNPSEIFVLLVSAWVHDFGMFCDFPFFSEEQSRKYHGRISGKVLSSMDRFPGIKHLTNVQKMAIYLVSAAHQSSFPISKLKDPINISHRSVRLYLLGSLLRIADALDILSYRANSQFLDYFDKFYGRPASPSVFEWNVNNCAISRVIENSYIQYGIQIPRHLQRRLVRLKVLDHRIDGIDKKHVEITQRHFDNYLKHIGKYIEYYIADHVLSIQDEGIKKLETQFLNHFKNFRISIPRIEDTPTTVSSIMTKRKRHCERLIGMKTFSMESINTDPKVNKLMEATKRATFTKTDGDIFMFLFDYENKLLKLWSYPNFYEGYARTHLIDMDPRTFCKALQDTSIPLKCGIVGYVAWMGQDEAVVDEGWDFRASYADFDRLLKLRNIMCLNIYDKNSLMGVFLFNFEREKDMGDFIRTHMSNRKKDCWERLKREYDYFRSLHKQIMKHCITK